jgi:hypothetical protein
VTGRCGGKLTGADDRESGKVFGHEGLHRVIVVIGGCRDEIQGAEFAVTGATFVGGSTKWVEICGEEACSVSAAAASAASTV